MDLFRKTPEEMNAMRKKAFSYLARVGIQKIIGFLLYLLGANFSLTLAGGIYFAYLFLATIIICCILFRANEETLAQRSKTDTDSPLWDKILLLFLWLLNYFIVYLIAGFCEKGEHLNFAFYSGIALTVIAAWISTKATLANTFLESTARIQSDRNQTVCEAGPYRFVRHPAYCGLIINCIGLCLIFPYVGVWLCMAATAVIIIIRTALEDRMLMRGLSGYSEYAARTKYRLLPFIW